MKMSLEEHTQIYPKLAIGRENRKKENKIILLNNGTKKMMTLSIIICLISREEGIKIIRI